MDIKDIKEKVNSNLNKQEEIEIDKVFRPYAYPAQAGCDSCSGSCYGGCTACGGCTGTCGGSCTGSCVVMATGCDSMASIELDENK